MKNRQSILRPNVFYHVYNRTNGNERMFRTEANYRYFLERYRHHLSSLVKTYAYCLMPDHFHLLISCRDDDELIAAYLKSAGGRKTSLSAFKTLTGFEQEQLLSKFISKQFSNLFNGYTQAYNRANERHGSLFSRPFQRIEMDGTRYFQQLVRYVHDNPVKAKLCENMSEWPFSSYNALVSDGHTQLERETVLEWFEGKDGFEAYHEQVDE